MPSPKFPAPNIYAKLTLCLICLQYQLDSLTEAMKAGFNEITDVIMRERPKRGLNPPNALKTTPPQRARHESMSDSNTDESEDVELAIDNLLKENSTEGDKNENKDTENDGNTNYVNIYFGKDSQVEKHVGLVT